MEMLLSLRIISKSLSNEDALLSPSKAIPPVIEPSPITATTFLSSPLTLAATAIPIAALMELDACPAVKVSYSLSLGWGNPANPSFFRSVSNCLRRPVKILWI